QDQNALACQPSSTGSYAVSVRATDVLGALAQGTVTFMVNALPNVDSLVANSSMIASGGSVELAATISGGTAPFQYQYAGLPTGCLGTDSALVSCASVPTGNYSVTLTAVDATGARASAVGTFQAVATTSPHQPIVTPAAGIPWFWWGLAVGALAILVAGVAGGYRLVLARQGEEIVRGLRTEPEGPSGTPAEVPEATRGADGPVR
ncbi:MAG TPA: hypothetical protein VIZ68_00495, partial [Thermoplasmata archaeon]